MKFSVLVISLLLAGVAHAEIQTVPSVDLTRYAGRWYQISANPMDFEKGCYCTQQTLTPMQEGTLGVYNSCNREAITGPLTEIRGVATNTNKQSNAQFTVDFGFQIKGNYWIIGLDPNYNWAVVSEPEGKALFILSKMPTLSDEQYTAAVALAGLQVDTSKLVMTTQAGCTYPVQ